MNEIDEEKGKKLILWISASSVVACIIVIVIYNLLLGQQQLIGQVIRFILTSTLCYFLYREKNWARWTMGILLALGGFLGLFVGMSFHKQAPAGAIILELMAIVYMSSAYLLFFNKNVKHHYFKERG